MCHAPWRAQARASVRVAAANKHPRWANSCVSTSERCIRDLAVMANNCCAVDCHMKYGKKPGDRFPLPDNADSKPHHRICSEYLKTRPLMHVQSAVITSLAILAAIPCLMYCIGGTLRSG